MAHRVIQTRDAPAAIGPYSQAVRVDGWVYASGQIPVDPRSGDVVVGGIAAQTHRALTNLKIVLEAADCTLEDVVKTTVYLADLTEFDAMNEAYARYFTVRPPARATVQVARLPKDVRIEVDAVARLSGHGG